MADLIDRAALLEDIEKTVIYTARDGVPSAKMRGANKITDRIKAAPAVDAVEVVRCKECKRYSRDEMFGGGYCDGVKKKLNDFCSYGERREDK